MKVFKPVYISIEKEDIADKVILQETEGRRKVTVGNRCVLAKRSYLEFVVYVPKFNRNVYRAITDRLEKYGIRSVFMCPGPPLGEANPNARWPHIRFLPHLYTEHEQRLNLLHDWLEDEDSKNILATCIKAQTTGNFGYYELSKFESYAHPSVILRPGDVIIDAGISTKDIEPTPTFSKLIGQAGHIYGF